MRLTCIPGIVLIPAAVAPAVIATVILFSKTENASDAKAITTASAEAADVAQTEENTEEATDISEE